MALFPRDVWMRWIIVLILVLLCGNSSGVFAQSTDASGCQLTLGGTGTHVVFKMGESLHIQTTPKCLAAMGITATDLSSVKLVLDHVGMAGLPVSALQTADPAGIILTFQLIRTSKDDDNRKGWDAILGKQHGTYEFTIPVALAVGNQPAWGVQAASPVKLHLANNTTVWLTFAVGVMIFLMVYYRLVKHPSILRDRPHGFYSLGKSQMVFWGLLVTFTFFGIWILTGKMEEVPAGVLALIGISAATSLGSKVIGDSQKAPALSLSPGGSASSQEVAEKTTFTVAVPVPTTDESQPVHESAGFWHDICDDGNGMSFHRLQVVMWTVVLGIIFLDAVAEAISMPEFSDTLLALQGMSNGTYLGFKIPEKT